MGRVPSNSLEIMVWSKVADTASTVRRAARVGARSTAVRALHRRAGSDRRAPRLHMYADDCQVYLNTSVEDVPLAVNKFAACVADINAWLSACRLRAEVLKSYTGDRKCE